MTTSPRRIPADTFAQPNRPSSSNSGNCKPGTLIYQPLRTINAEEMKKGIKLLEEAEEEYEAQDGDGDTVQPEILEETFPACANGEELNVGDVLSTCNFLFRDA